MGRKRAGARVLGPYYDRVRDRWRVVQIDEEGSRTPHYADTETKARLLIKACRLDLGVSVHDEVTVGGAVDAFLEHKRKAKAWDPRTFERTGADLRQFAQENNETPVSLVNIAWIHSYLSRIAYLALASQKSRFHAVSEFLGWCVAKGTLRTNPAKAVDRSELPWVGKRARRQIGRGKPQLRNLDEVRQYLVAASCLSTPTERVAASLPLLTGLRAGAIRHLRVADVDFKLDRLWSRSIEEDEDLPVEWDVKTASSTMTVDLPETLRADLAFLCQDRSPNEFVLRSAKNPKMKGGPYDRKWLSRVVRRVCKLAGTKSVCAHGLRDTYTTVLAALAGKSAADVAKLVGHDDGGQTAKRHYIGVAEHKPALKLE